MNWVSKPYTLRNIGRRQKILARKLQNSIRTGYLREQNIVQGTDLSRVQLFINHVLLVGTSGKVFKEKLITHSPIFRKTEVFDCFSPPQRQLHSIQLGYESNS